MFVLACADIACVSYIIWKIIHIAILYIVTLTLDLISIDFTYQYLNTSIEQTTASILETKHCLQRNFNSVLKFLKVQNQIFENIHESDQQWSSVYFMLLFVNIPSNVYLIVYFCFIPLGITEKIMLAAVLAVQLLCMIVLFILAQIALILHSPAKYMVHLQALIKEKRLIKLKLEFMLLFEKLNGNKRIGYTAGPLGVINKPTLVQVQSIALKELYMTKLLFCIVHFLLLCLSALCDSILWEAFIGSITPICIFQFVFRKWASV